MSTTIDYSDPAEYIINVLRADMKPIQSDPFEVRELNVNDFRKELMDLQDNVEHQWAPTTHVHTAPLTVAGVTLARVVTIIDPYRVEFEDGQYNVNIVGGNSNMADVQIKNQVGINTANSAGLQDPLGDTIQIMADEVVATMDTDSQQLQTMPDQVVTAMDSDSERLKEIAGLVHKNTVIDNFHHDGFGNVDQMRIRMFANEADASNATYGGESPPGGSDPVPIFERTVESLWSAKGIPMGVRQVMVQE